MSCRITLNDSIEHLQAVIKFVNPKATTKLEAGYGVITLTVYDLKRNEYDKLMENPEVQFALNLVKDKVYCGTFFNVLCGSSVNTISEIISKLTEEERLELIKLMNKTTNFI